MRSWTLAALVAASAGICAGIGLPRPALSQNAAAPAAQAQNTQAQNTQPRDGLALPPGLSPSLDWSEPQIAPREQDAEPQSEGITTMGVSPDDSATIARIERYLNSLSSVHARFVQVSTNGSFAEGEVHIQRPGKLRFEYDDPHPALLIANGLTLLYYDRELKQATFLPLWETPLWFLIRDEVELADDIEIVDVIQENGSLAIILEDSSSGDVGRITLTFSDKPLRLHKWEVVDAQGIITQVSLLNAQYDIPIAKSVFEYDDLPIDTPGLNQNRGN